MYKQIYTKFISALFPKNFSRVAPLIYLMFHSVQDGDGLPNHSIYNISVARFKEICELLYELKKMAEKESGRSVEIIFTFDDGYRNFIENALPILEKYSFNSVVFLIAKNLDDRSGRYINRKDLVTFMNHKNIIFGLHGYSHTDLTSLSYDMLKKELSNIKQVCQSLGFRSNYFSLPFGRANNQVMKNLREYGYTEVFTSDYGFKVANNEGQNIYPRIDIWSDDSNNMIQQKIMRRWKIFFIIASYRANLFRVRLKK